jgi:nucleotide-binding universal stress UspA family protein
MFHRILVAVDDSKAAGEALQRAVELADASHGRLGLLCSAPKPPPMAPGPVALPVSYRQIEAELLEWARRNVEDAASRVPEEIPVTKLVTRGAPGRAVLREARTGCWDLIVVGQAHRRFHVGRVGDWLNRHSPTPVLVVHEEPDATPRKQRTGLLGRWWRSRRAQIKPA